MEAPGVGEEAGGSVRSKEGSGGSIGYRGVSWEEHLREINTINEDSKAEILYLASEIIRYGWRVATYLPLRSRFHTRPPISFREKPWGRGWIPYWEQ